MKEFKCRRCGNCCRWPGAVKLEPGEAEKIAAFLNMSEMEFFDAHTRLTPDRRHLSLIEKADGSCEYLTVDETGLACCSIDVVKPVQCRDFPGKWNFPDWQKLCGAFSDESI